MGGKIFCILKTHLLSVEGSYFHAMLASGQWNPDSEGDAYFIDLNPKQFDRVIEYLRTSELSFEGLRPDQIKTLRNSVDYLQLPVRVPVTWDPNACDSGLRLSHGNRAITSNERQQSVRSVYPCARFCVRLDEVGFGVMIGFTPEAGFTANGASYARCGWYLYTHNGAMFSQGGTADRNYVSGRVKAGSVVTCILDQERNIELEVNGHSWGVAFANVPQGEVFASLCVLSSSRLWLVDDNAK